MNIFLFISDTLYYGKSRKKDSALIFTHLYRHINRRKKCKFRYKFHAKK